MRTALLALCLLAAPALTFAPTSASAETDHLAESNGLRILHAWTPATARGSDALIYFDLENAAPSDVVLTGGAAMGQPLDLVGFSYGAAGEVWTVLPGLPVPAGAEVLLEPKVLALQWTSVPQDLLPGGELEITVQIGGQSLQTHVEIGAADATGHSHAGHSH